MILLIHQLLVQPTSSANSVTVAFDTNGYMILEASSSAWLRTWWRKDQHVPLMRKINQPHFNSQYWVLLQCLRCTLATGWDANKLIPFSFHRRQACGDQRGLKKFEDKIQNFHDKRNICWPAMHLLRHRMRLNWISTWEGCHCKGLNLPEVGEISSIGRWSTKTPTMSSIWSLKEHVNKFN